MRYKVSIIVPIYNVEKYVDNCIKSLCKNRREDVELILVDDGSKDNSSQIINRYQNKNGISIIHKENGGVSSARNAGLRVATGEYIIFIDPDDWVTDSFYELIPKLLIDDPEVVVMGYFNYNEINECKKSIELTSQSMVMEVNEAIPLLDVKGYFFNFPWNKIYRKSILDGIWFEEGTTYCEDLLFNVEVFKRIRSVKISSEKYYIYRTTVSSSTNNRYYEDYYNLAMKAINARRDLYNYYHLNDMHNLLEQKENEYYVGVILNIYKKKNPLISSKRVEIIKSVSRKMHSRKTYNRRLDLIITLRNCPRILDVILNSFFYMKKTRGK